MHFCLKVVFQRGNLQEHDYAMAREDAIILVLIKNITAGADRRWKNIKTASVANPHVVTMVKV